MGVEFAGVPELHAELRASSDVSVGDDDAVARPDYAGAVAAATCVDENRGAPEIFRDFTEVGDGHFTWLRGRARRP